MIALILNSRIGTRMGTLTLDQPKCMTVVMPGKTIPSRQFRMISKVGIRDVVITTGYHDSTLINYCKELDMPLNIRFVKNERYAETNYGLSWSRKLYLIKLSVKQGKDAMIGYLTNNKLKCPI